MSVGVAHGFEVLQAVNGRPTFTPGGVFWFGDEYIMNGYWTKTADHLTFFNNIIAAQVGPGAKRVGVVDQGNSDADTIVADLIGSGHTASKITSAIVPSTASFDYIFGQQQNRMTGGNVAIWAFVQSGGGFFSPMGQGGFSEGTAMAVLLTNSGVTYSPSYIWQLPETQVAPYNVGSSPYFTGVSKVYLYGAGQFTGLSSPPSGGYSHRWEGQKLSTTERYYVFADWRPV